MECGDEVRDDDRSEPLRFAVNLVIAGYAALKNRWLVAHKISSSFENTG
jgi:hypothetical protein